MAAREYMIEFRQKHGINLRDMARACGISQQLLSMLEYSAREVTHPEIAERVGKKYRLTKAQIEGMKPENYRVDSPNYDPNRYRALPDMVIVPKSKKEASHE